MFPESVLDICLVQYVFIYSAAAKMDITTQTGVFMQGIHPSSLVRWRCENFGAPSSAQYCQFCITFDVAQFLFLSPMFSYFCKDSQLIQEMQMLNRN